MTNSTFENTDNTPVKPGMKSGVDSVPEGFHTATPFLIVNDANGLVEFMKKGLDAEEVYCLRMDDGSIMHAQMKIGNSMVLVGGASGMPEMLGAIYLYLEDADAAYEKAVGAGGKSIIAPRDEFYGDRMGGIKDPFGNTWWFATHIEDVPEDELRKRAKEACAMDKKH
jgi:uncharacterized glyoxalase superfamily protein PhnB